MANNLGGLFAGYQEGVAEVDKQRSQQLADLMQQQHILTSNQAYNQAEQTNPLTLRNLGATTAANEAKVTPEFLQAQLDQQQGLGAIGRAQGISAEPEANVKAGQAGMDLEQQGLSKKYSQIAGVIKQLEGGANPQDIIGTLDPESAGEFKTLVDGSARTGKNLLNTLKGSLAMAAQKMNASAMADPKHIREIDLKNMDAKIKSDHDIAADNRAARNAANAVSVANAREDKAALKAQETLIIQDAARRGKELQERAKAARAEGKDFLSQMAKAEGKEKADLQGEADKAAKIARDYDATAAAILKESQDQLKQLRNPTKETSTSSGSYDAEYDPTSRSIVKGMAPVAKPSQSVAPVPAQQSQVKPPSRIQSTDDPIFMPVRKLSPYIWTYNGRTFKDAASAEQARTYAIQESSGE